jgi:hypothetical protein
LLVPSLRLDLSAATHRRILFGDAEQLEPEPLHLKSAGQHFRTELRHRSLTPQDLGDLRLSIPDQPEQE